MKVTEPLIKLCLAELTKQAAAKQRYKDYCDGRHAILTDYAMQDSRSNRKLIFNFPRKFVHNETGYLLGKPVNFISKSDYRQAVECIDRNTAHWEKEHNISLRKASEIFGEAYELNYIDPAALKGLKQGHSICEGGVTGSKVRNQPAFATGT